MVCIFKFFKLPWGGGLGGEHLKRDVAEVATVELKFIPICNHKDNLMMPTYLSHLCSNFEYL